MKQGNRNKLLGPGTLVEKHNNLYYISRQFSLLRVSPQRLIGVEDAEKVVGAERRDGGQVNVLNTKDCKDVERNQIITEFGGQERSYDPGDDKVCIEDNLDQEGEDGDQGSNVENIYDCVQACGRRNHDVGDLVQDDSDQVQ